MGTNVRWLHLSDFHVGMDNYAQRKLFDEICDHIKVTVDSGCIPDFVFITGDLANKGLASEYTEFYEAFLVPMKRALGNSWSGKVIAIPGNHDVERPRTPYFLPEEILQNQEKLFDPTVDGQFAREQFFLRFSNYSDYDLTSVPNRWLNSEAGSFSIETNIRGCNVGLVGINTAWLSKDNHDRHKLTPGIHLLDDALAKIKDCRLKVVLGHHPLDWLDDAHAKKMRGLLGKHSCLYLHGHLHANEGRYEDGGQGEFLTIRCGSAFQGRPEDKEKWINGLMWAEVKLQEGFIELTPLHWSTEYPEWKLTTDAFPNKYASEGSWAFPLPGSPRSPGACTVQVTTKVSKSKAPPRSEDELRPGWALVDTSFLEKRAGNVTKERLLQFFDGSPPSWQLALSAFVPEREVVERLRSRFLHLDDASKPTVVNLLGPGGEGKSTIFLQTVTKLVREDGWVALWRYNDLEQIDAATIQQLARSYPKLLIAVDEAHSIAPRLASLLSRLSRHPSPHFLICSRTLDWRAEVREMGSITVASDYQEIFARGINRLDAELLVTAWAHLGKKGLGALDQMHISDAADALLNASRDQEGDTLEGALFGAMLKV